jgi:hypothetical protein
MFQRPGNRGLLPVLLTAGLLLARVAAAPPLTDPTGAPLPAALHLAIPPLYLVLAPLFSIWDGVSMLSMSRLEGFLGGLVLGLVLWRGSRVLWGRLAWTAGLVPRHPWRREAGALVVAALGLGGFIAAGLLWHRPMLSLEGAAVDDVVTDFHSHTNVSHDVRGTLMRGFDTRANLAWHRRAGFDAVFLTDHNSVAGLRAAPPEAEVPFLCPGIEISAWRAHIVLLGSARPIDRTQYNGSLDHLLTLLRSSDSAYGARSLASLPEYERNHWDRLPELVAAGLDGFEIVNASPRANELSRVKRDSVVALARRANRFVAGVSDSHGWGATSMVWNLVRVPRWRETPAVVCPAILARLGAGFPAVRVVERHRLRPDSVWPWFLTPIGVVWETWRSMGWLLTASWLAWVWGVWVARRGRGAADR